MVKTYFRFIIFIIWSFFVIFYILINSFPKIDSYNFVLDDIGFILFFLFISASFGRVCLKILGIYHLDFNIKFLFSIGLALGFISFILFFFGIFGLFKIEFFILFLIFISGISLKEAIKWIEEFKEIKEEDWNFFKYYLIAIGLFTLLSLLASLTPPTARDDLIHHLAYPKLYLEKGKFYDTPFGIFSYYPMALEMLYTFVMGLSSDIAPKILHFSFFILSSYATFILGRTFLDKKYSIIAIFLFTSIPIVLNTASKAYVDMGLIFYTILAIYAFFLFKEKSDVKFLFLFGIFSGMAYNSKYNGLVFIIIFIFSLLILASRKKISTKEAIKYLFIFSFIIVLIISPWILRNFLLKGNPLYPLYSNIFGGEIFQPEAPKISSFQYRLIFEGGLIQQFLIPFKVSVKMTRDEYFSYDGILGPLFLILIPFVILLPNKPTNLVILGYISLSYFIIAWFTEAIRLRYYMPIYPLLAIISSYGIQKLEEVNFTKWMTKLLIILFSIYNLFVTFINLREVDPLPFLAGLVSKEEYLLKNLYDYHFFKFMNENLPYNAKVFMIYSNRGYYLDRDYIYDSHLGGYTLKLFIKKAKSEDELSNMFKNLGITHIYLDLNALSKDIEINRDDFSDKNLEIFSNFLNKNVKVLYEKDNVIVAKVNTHKKLL